MRPCPRPLHRVFQSLLLLCALSAAGCVEDPPAMMEGAPTDLGVVDMAPSPPAPLLPAIPLNAFQLRGYVDSFHLPPEDPQTRAAHEEWLYSRPSMRIQAGLHALRLYDLDFLSNPTNNGITTYLNTKNTESHCGTMMLCFDDLLDHFDRNAHNDHGPIVVLLRPTVLALSEGPYAGDQVAARLIAVLEREFRREMPVERIFRPNELQGEHPSLRAAVEADGWPSTRELAGRFILVLHDEDESRARYRERFGFFPPHALDEDPVLFTLADGPDDPDGVFITVPAADTERIEAYARAGLIVHVDVDMHTFEPARRAGAHLFTSMELEEMPMPGSPASCNPVTAPMGCAPDAYETPHPEMPWFPRGELDELDGGVPDAR